MNQNLILPLNTKPLFDVLDKNLERISQIHKQVKITDSDLRECDILIQCNTDLIKALEEAQK